MLLSVLIVGRKFTENSIYFVLSINHLVLTDTVHRNLLQIIIKEKIFFIVIKNSTDLHKQNVEKEQTVQFSKRHFSNDNLLDVIFYFYFVITKNKYFFLFGLLFYVSRI